MLFLRRLRERQDVCDCFHCTLHSLLVSHAALLFQHSPQLLEGAVREKQQQLLVRRGRDACVYSHPQGFAAHFLGGRALQESKRLLKNSRVLQQPQLRAAANCEVADAPAGVFAETAAVLFKKRAQSSQRRGRAVAETASLLPDACWSVVARHARATVEKRLGLTGSARRNLANDAQGRSERQLATVAVPRVCALCAAGAAADSAAGVCLRCFTQTRGGRAGPGFHSVAAARVVSGAAADCAVVDEDVDDLPQELSFSQQDLNAAHLRGHSVDGPAGVSRDFAVFRDAGRRCTGGDTWGRRGTRELLTQRLREQGKDFLDDLQLRSSRAERRTHEHDGKDSFEESVQDLSQSGATRGLLCPSLFFPRAHLPLA